MHFLLIDTSTERGVIAYGHRDEIFFAKELPFGSAQSQYLLPYLSEALHSFSFPPRLAAIGVGIGPGSYTGIRLGVSVAQALAYSWNLPLIGLSSLEGFVPSTPFHQYAAILDARIGGVYLQKGELDQKGEVIKSSPEIISLEEAGRALGDIVQLVTPFAQSLQVKFKHSYPQINWMWEERSPSVEILFEKIEVLFKAGKGIAPPKQLDLLYLRKTEAEREKEFQKQKECV
ncbi:MAG: tRNA (adenosine(37)-N6)-threonylcarbamoyltransferase complex dimerization subunit type 1 TsaB [Parachlamydiaceae bacterium]